MSWQKFWVTHNKIFVFASIFAFFLSGVFLVFAYQSNSEANLLSQNEISQTVSGTLNQTISPPKSESDITQFLLPNALGNAGAPDYLTVYCTAYSNEFVQGNPATVIVNITRDNILPEVFVVGAGFEVKPLDTISVEMQNLWWQPYNGGYYEIPEPNALGSFTAFGGYNSNSVWITEQWYGSDTMIFQNSGPITLQISASLSPTQDVRNYVNWTTFPTDFNVNVTLPNIYIQSSTSIQQQSLAQQELSQQQAETTVLNLMQTQQKINDFQNSSLTFFVLFFACIDIAVVIFDHSKDDDKKADYEKKKTEEESRNKIKDIV